MTQNTRSRLVAVAAELLDRGGPAAVTLRDVGKRAGVSHNAPYKHFPSKEDLLAAIASGELERQAQAMSALYRGKRPLESLRALMHAYVRWAESYPQRFRLTFGAWTHDSEELGEAANRSRALLISIVEAAQAALDTDPSLRAADLVGLISDRFGISVHPRSVERALARERNPKSGGR